jgi:hypothetical protein
MMLINTQLRIGDAVGGRGTPQGFGCMSGADGAADLGGVGEALSGKRCPKTLCR